MRIINTKNAILFYSILIFILSACGGSSSDKSTSNSKACEAYRVINGAECSNDDLPTVLLEVVTRGRAGICTGTLISNDYILTAAHCLHPGPVNSVTVINGRRSQAANAFAVNPAYINSKLRNAFDVALIKADGFASGSRVSPARLGASTSLKRGETLAFIGYGQDNDGNFGTNLPGENPRAAFLKIEDFRNGIIFNVFEGTKSNPCFGDSGGAAVKDGKIVGIESAGTTDTCRTGDVNLFAAIRNKENLDFIRSLVPSVGID